MHIPLKYNYTTIIVFFSLAVLNTGFDEIVVESNLQVHNRVGSKNKSKIMLPSNSTTQAHKSRSLVV